MLQSVAKKIFGSRNDREIKRMRAVVTKVNSFEPALQKLSQEQLAAKTVEFRERLSKGEPLDALLPEAFAVAREMSKRVLNMRHFDVQLIGGMVLHEGKVSEMRTGEGKTLVATLPVYLNALPGKGVHVITVNDYLARRDAEWMGQLYKALGLTVGIIVHGLDDNERRQAYAADVTYGTNNEFGFDYLRDNMKFRLADYVQRELNYAIVDEVDSILIDEARTPLIISGPTDDSTDKYYLINSVIPLLQRGRDTRPKREGEEEEIESSEEQATEEKGQKKEAKKEDKTPVLEEIGGLATDMIHGVFSSGVSIYAATNEGLSLFRGGEKISFANRTMGDGLPTNTIQAVYAMGTLVLGATPKGLAVSHDGGSTFHARTTQDGLGSNTVNATVASSNAVFAGTEAGLSVSEDGGNSFVNRTTKEGLPNNEVRCLYGQEKTLYVGTTGGLAISTDSGKSFRTITTAQGLPHNTVNAIFASGKNLYVGTNGGLAISHNTGESFQVKNSQTGLPGNSIKAVSGSGNFIFVGTSEGFFVSADGGKTFTPRKKEQGLFNETVHGVHASGNTVYVATSGGVFISEDNAKVFTTKVSTGMDGDYTVDEKSRTVALTESGVMKIEKALRVANIYAPEHIELVHHIHQALKAHAIFERDVDYVVKEGEVIIVDEFTGRLMPGRRYSDGLHQALEAKENVKIENENQTLATITFQNYFRMYKKLAGMTGTADTEAAEFQNIYKLEVLVVPTNRPMVRKDNADSVYKTEKGKYRAVCAEIEELHKKKQPVLVGTISIEKSEYISSLLRKRGVPHNVLNAKQHEREAEIVANAGQPGAVTIATNMAGRGTDIVLGPGVPQIGGLHIIGTERHESRRIDNQLRGRAGRQGDPGSSRFYLSLEDNLLRIFQGEKIKGYMDRFNMEEDVPIESGLISRAIENAQKKVESHNFDIRKHLLEYDDVLNKQREVVYELRRLILGGENTRALILDIVREQVDSLVETFASAKMTSEWDTKGLLDSLLFLFDNILGFTHDSITEFEDKTALAEAISKRAEELYDAREKQISVEHMRNLEQYIYLGTIDQLWKDHLLNMDHLKEGVGLRGYGQKDPLVEYKKEGFTLFKLMDDQVKTDVITKLYRVQITREEQVEELQPKEQVMTFTHGGDEASAVREPSKRDEDKVGRNDPCPCGSGKKYKKCHGG